jgi:bacterioferritin-associated ferredoxin
MEPDDHICLCHRVSLRKLINFMNREEPSVPSQLSECLGAGTGCQWCVPFLKKLHCQWAAGEEPGISVTVDRYATRRQAYQAKCEAQDDGGVDHTQT